MYVSDLRYYLKYRVLITIILILGLKEAFKLLVSMYLFISREYSVVKEFVTVTILQCDSVTLEVGRSNSITL